MTEEDTFKKLKRKPFLEVLQLRNYIWDSEERKKVVIDSGWTLEDFYIRRDGEVFRNKE